MTWNDLASLISRMSPSQRRRSILLIEAYDEPERRAFGIEVMAAHEPVYCGHGIGCDLVLADGDVYLRKSQRT